MVLVDDHDSQDGQDIEAPSYHKSPKKNPSTFVNHHRRHQY
jgi:hypothetical protein